MPKSYIITEAMVLEFDSEAIVKGSVTVEQPKERFVPLAVHLAANHEIRLLVNSMTIASKPPSLWAALKLWWKAKRYVKGIVSG